MADSVRCNNLLWTATVFKGLLLLLATVALVDATVASSGTCLCYPKWHHFSVYLSSSSIQSPCLGQYFTEFTNLISSFTNLEGGWCKAPKSAREGRCIVIQSLSWDNILLKSLISTVHWPNWGACVKHLKVQGRGGAKHWAKWSWVNSSKVIAVNKREVGNWWNGFVVE